MQRGLMESLFLRKKLCNGELTQSSTHVSIYIAILDSPDTYTIINIPTQTKERKKNQNIPFNFSLGNGW